MRPFKIIIVSFFAFVFLTGNLFSQTSVKSIYFTGQYIFAGTNNGIFKKELNASEWKRCSSGLPDHTEISILKDFKNHLYCVDQGKSIFQMNLSDTVWNKISIPKECTKITSLYSNDTSLFIIDADHGILFSSDPAKSWKKFSVFKGEPGDVENNEKRKKNDKKNNSVTIAEPKKKITDLIIKDQCYFTGISSTPPEHGVYKSCNGGKTWEEASFELQKINIKKIIPTETKIYIITSGLNSEMYFSEKDGSRWIKFTKPPLRWVTLLCADNKLVFTANHRDGVCVSYDFGYTWEKLENLKLKPEQTIEFITLKNRILYIGTSDGLITMNETKYVWNVASEELNNDESANYFYAEIGNKNNVILSAGKFADKIIFKAENNSDKKVKIEINLLFECSTNNETSVLPSQKMDWLIEVEPHTVISFESNPKKCSVSACAEKTVRWEITNWNVN